MDRTFDINVVLLYGVPLKSNPSLRGHEKIGRVRVAERGGREGERKKRRRREREQENW